jgi:hypothetical protein
MARKKNGGDEVSWIELGRNDGTWRLLYSAVIGLLNLLLLILIAGSDDARSQIPQCVGKRASGSWLNVEQRTL